MHLCKKEMVIRSICAGFCKVSELFVAKIRVNVFLFGQEMQLTIYNFIVSFIENWICLLVVRCNFGL